MCDGGDWESSLCLDLQSQTWLFGSLVFFGGWGAYFTSSVWFVCMCMFVPFVISVPSMGSKWELTIRH